MQNEVIACIAESIRRKIIFILENSFFYSNNNFYSIIVDEVTDRYVNKEVLLLCLWFLYCLKNKPTILPSFSPDSTHIKGRLTGEIICRNILEMLEKHKINIQDCLTQSYGANEMKIESIEASP